MKVIYDKKAQRIDLISDTLKFCVAFITNDELVFDCATIKLDIATKLFQRWHQIERDEPEFIARALNDALNDGPFIYIGTSKWHLYAEGVFDCEFLRELICDEVGPLKSLDYFDSLTVKHNIDADQLENFVDDRFKGWLPFVREEITS